MGSLGSLGSLGGSAQHTASDLLCHVRKPPSRDRMDGMSPCGFSSSHCGLLLLLTPPQYLPSQSPRGSPGCLCTPLHSRPGGTCPLQMPGSVTSVPPVGPGLPLSASQVPAISSQSVTPGTLGRWPSAAQSLLILLLGATHVARGS